jgi:hypothetical protein
VDFATVAAEVGVAYVVDDDDEDIGLGLVRGAGFSGGVAAVALVRP